MGRSTSLVHSLDERTGIFLRISTFGRFQIDWVDPATGQTTPLPSERLHGQNAGSALGLLKALLSCPNRFATRSWLNEQFWPTSRNKAAEERLNDVVSSLRTLLRPQGSTEMLVHFVYGTSGRGAGYRLNSYPQLWCDADAFEWYVKHGLLLDQRGQDSTACWEHAYLLAERGIYLPEQIEEDWSRLRRDHLSGLMRDCIHRWTQILRQMGHVDEAIMRLRSYWLEHPTDEDALRPLLDMLGECGRFGEAEECYAKARGALSEENHIPDERTTDAIETVRALKVRRPPFKLTPFRAISRTISSVPPALFSSSRERQEEYDSVCAEPAIISRQPDSSASVAHSSFPVESFFLQEEGSIEKPWVLYDMLECEILTMLLQRRLSSDSLFDLQQWMYETIRKHDAMHKDLSGTEAKVTRRHALQAIATFPIQMYGLTHLISEMRPLPLNEVLPICAAGITACRELLRDEPDGLIAAKHRLPAYFPLLEQVARQSSSYQSVAARLASQSYLLLSVLAEHDGKLDQMEAATRQARFYGHCAQDVDLEISALIRLAVKFDYEHKDRRALETYQEALAHPDFSTASLLLQGRVYAGLAGTHAYCSQTPQALSFLSQAREIYPDKPEADSTYPFAFCDRNTLVLWEGLTLKHTDHCAEALNAFTRFGKLTPIPGLLELHRAEHLNYAASVAVQQRNLDAAVMYLDVAEDIAWHLQDAMRLAEVHETLRGMRLLWPDEKPVKIMQEKCAERR